MSEIRLPQRTLESIFHDGVETPEMNRTSALSKPKAVFLGGQPGCGKSTFAKMSSTWFASGGFVHLDVDRYRDLHPAYLPMVKSQATELLAPSAVQKDCSQWVDMLSKSATTNNRNQLIENTMRDPAQVRATSKTLRNAGYEIEVRIVAVHSSVSEVSLLKRFENEKQVLGYGRSIPLTYHNQAAAGISKSIEAIEVEKLADHLMVFDRQGNVLHENHLINGEWQFPQLGASQFEKLRNDAFDFNEQQRVVSHWDDVVSMMHRRGASETEMSPILQRREAVKTSLSQPYAVPSLETPIEDITQGEFNGRIIEHTNNGNGVVQKIGRDPDQVAYHARKNLTRVPDVGEVVTIKYRFGVGQVTDKAIVRQIEL